MTQNRTGFYASQVPCLPCKERPCEARREGGKAFYRTLKEEFVEDHRELLEEKETKAFNSKLIDYLLFYNTQRPHNSLGNQKPVKIVVEYLKKSNMYWTDTGS